MAFKAKISVYQHRGALRSWSPGFLLNTFIISWAAASLGQVAPERVSLSVRIESPPALELSWSASAEGYVLQRTEPLPAGTRVVVTFQGDDVADANGEKVDADGDGAPGGTLRLPFDTMSLAPGAGAGAVPSRH